MLRTNTKKAYFNLSNYLLDSLQAEETAPTTTEEAIVILADGFYNEIVKHDQRIASGSMSLYDGFKYWAQGLSRSTFNYYYNMSGVDLLGDILEESEEEKSRFTEAQAEEKLTALIYNMIHKELMLLIEYI